jgi:hypothetical protein
MKALQGATKMAFLGFWISHIFFTILIDGQVVVPHLFPTVLREFLAWYCALFSDPLMSSAVTSITSSAVTESSPSSLLWFQALVTCELCFQLPFFIVAVRMLLLRVQSSKHHEHDDRYPDWFRYACIAYGSHTATTMAPILATLIVSSTSTAQERVTITALYLPYLIFPLWILRLAVQDDNDDNSSTTISSISKKQS